MGLEQLNLNLLPALDALLRERSVSAAAARMGVSQSAMSHSLAKLRVVLDDPLLVVSGRTMSATPRAEALALSLPPLLDALSDALSEPAEFEPKTARRRFRIATLDYFEFTTLPNVLEFLRLRAPGIGLDIERLDSGSAVRLVEGDIDLVIGGESMSMPSVLMQRLLYRDPFAVVVRPDHPRIKGRLSLDQYLALDHVLISVEGRADGLVDRVLAEQATTRRVALRLPHFATAALAVLHSDMVCTVSSTVAKRARDIFGVRVLTPPLDLPAAGAVAWWPKQFQDDPARRWFRQVLFTGKAVSPQIRRLMRELRKPERAL